MTREEFDKKVEELGSTTKGLSNEDYKRIEYVYNFHPSISEIDGKRQVAVLYFTLGIVPFYDMMPRAAKAEKLEEEMRRARQELERAKGDYERLKEEQNWNN